MRKKSLPTPSDLNVTPFIDSTSLNHQNQHKMKTTSLLCALFVFVVVICAMYDLVSATPDSKCLGCICHVESNCRAIGCHFDVTGTACGYYQIHEGYFHDCKEWGDWGKGEKITMGWKECSDNYSCSTACVKNYLNRYGTYCTGGSAPTCQDYARIHNGGPKGCKSSSTIGYWNKVKACYQ